MRNQLSLIPLLCLVLTLLSFDGFSQTAQCGSTLPENYQSNRSKNPVAYESFLQNFKQRATQPAALRSGGSGSCVNYAPIKAHILRNSDGSGGLTTAELDAAIADMNTIYADACMAFYQCGAINYIDEDTLYDFNQHQEALLTSTFNVADVINIYFCNSVRESYPLTNYYCGYAYYPGGPDVVLMDNSCTVNGSTFSHELGHFFSLPHTHGNSNTVLTDELVNGSNCTTAGDEFCDTPADPKLSTAVVDGSCVYTGATTDDNGDTFLPSTINLMSYSRKSCRTEFTTEQLAAISFTFLTVRNYWACADFDVDFSVDNDNSCESPFTVTFSESAVGESSYEWDFENDGTVDHVGPNPSHTYTTDGAYDVCLSVSDGTTTISRVRTAYINVGSNAMPFNSDMENFTPSLNATGFENGWTTSPSGTSIDFRWNIDAGGTISSNTGPEVDHSLGTAAGLYIYAEATDGSSGDMAELISPCLAVPAGGVNDYSISFWYHMYGAGMGTLHVDLHDGTSWINDYAPAIAGQQQMNASDSYLEKVFSVADYDGQSIQIRLRAERSTSFQSDIAIDDFQFFNAGILPVELMNFQGKVNEKRQHELSWQTATEINSDYFLIEHSHNARDFETIGSVRANSNTDTQMDYDFAYANPKVGVSYYRLKIVDLDETFEYSDIISLNRQETDSRLSIYPNPGSGVFFMETPHDDEVLFFDVYNTVGQKVKSDRWLPSEGNYPLDLKKHTNGIYTIHVRTNNRVFAVKKFIKVSLH